MLILSQGERDSLECLITTICEVMYEFCILLKNETKTGSCFRRLYVILPQLKHFRLEFLTNHKYLGDLSGEAGRLKNKETKKFSLDSLATRDVSDLLIQKPFLRNKFI